MKWFCTAALLASAALVSAVDSPAGSAPGKVTAGAPGGAVVKGLDGFPIAVWLQDPRNAAKYRAIGINVYLGLWEGPTAAQLSALEKAEMPAICDQNAEGLKPRWKNEILGWLQEDEPDNAQELPNNKGYGPPILPEKIVARYQEMKKADPDRPVILNLGQGVAWDGWYGRGTRSNKPEDYPLYAKGGDIVGFDIYPVVHDRKEVAGKLWYVGHGVERLVKWTDGQKPVWSCIECTHIGNAAVKPTPAQVKSEVWMAIIHGAHGITYFAHQFAPKFVEAAVLDDADMSKAIREINHQVQTLAPAILSAAPAPVALAAVESSGGEKAPIAVMTRRWDGATYVFAVGMREAAVQGTFALAGAAGNVEVIGENRTVPAAGGKWTDGFEGYQVHLYKLGGK